VVSRNACVVSFMCSFAFLFIPYLHYAISQIGGDEVGGSLLDFVSENNSRYSENEIREMFNSLATEGMIYSTIDENHFSTIS